MKNINGIDRKSVVIKRDFSFHSDCDFWDQKRCNWDVYETDTI